MSIQDVTTGIGTIASILLGNQAPVLAIGAKVRLPDGRVGWVQNIAVSPYYDEERRGVWRVYVYAEKWFDEVNPERWVDWVTMDECEVLS